MKIKQTVPARVRAVALPRRKLDREVYGLRTVMAAAGSLIIVGALNHNAGTVVLALAACLTCATRIEHLYRQGAYGRAEPERFD